jgi:hypothetical protein
MSSHSVELMAKRTRWAVALRVLVRSMPVIGLLVVCVGSEVASAVELLLVCVVSEVASAVELASVITISLMLPVSHPFRLSTVMPPVWYLMG